MKMTKIMKLMKMMEDDETTKITKMTKTMKMKLMKLMKLTIRYQIETDLSLTCVVAKKSPFGEKLRELTVFFGANQSIILPVGISTCSSQYMEAEQ
jgi:hypothetical protein